MRHWSCLLWREILGLPDVSSRPMLGMTAVYRGNAIFGVLPRTRAMDTPYSVSFKILWPNPSLKKRLEADPVSCPVPKTRPTEIPAVFSHNYKWRREWDFWPGTSPGYTDRTWFPDKMAYLVRAHYVRPIGQKLLAAILSRREARAPRLNLFSQRDSLE